MGEGLGGGFRGRTWIGEIDVWMRGCGPETEICVNSGCDGETRNEWELLKWLQLDGQHAWIVSGC